MTRVLFLALSIAAPARVIAPQRLAGIVHLPDGVATASGVLVPIADPAGNPGASAHARTATSVDTGPARASIAGLVTDAADAAPVAGAQVHLAPSEISRTTDSAGRFEFLGVADGDSDVGVRRIGYEPASVHVRINAGKPSDLKIALRRLPAVLAEVRIDGRMRKVPPRFEAVYRRAASGWGRFILREDIEQANALTVKSLLMNIPGVLVNDRGITFQRCQAGIPGPKSSAQPAKVQVYIDGVQVTHYNTEDSGLEEALKLVHPSGIQAIEVYTGVARIPAEFLSDACAVIAIWTRAN